MTPFTVRLTTHFTGRELPYARDPVAFWMALVGIFGIMVTILGLLLGNAFAARRAAMLSFVNSYQIEGEAAVPQRPVRVILMR